MIRVVEVGKVIKVVEVFKVIRVVEVVYRYEENLGVKGPNKNNNNVGLRITNDHHCKDKRGSTSQKLCYDRNHNWVVAVIMLTGN